MSKKARSSQYQFENHSQNTGAYQACSALLNGVFYVFGGLTTASFLNDQSTRFDGLNGQISKLTNCSTLERTGVAMTYHSEGGACGTFGNVILLCFDFKNPNACHSFDGVEFKPNTTSLYEHYGSKLGSYHDQPFVVGHLSTLDELQKTAKNSVEILNVDGSWEEKNHYPFSDGISKYGIVSTNDSGRIIRI